MTFYHCLECGETTDDFWEEMHSATGCKFYLCSNVCWAKFKSAHFPPDTVKALLGTNSPTNENLALALKGALRMIDSLLERVTKLEEEA